MLRSCLRGDYLAFGSRKEVRQRAAGRDVARDGARGDVIVLAAGDRVPADAARFTEQCLAADHSKLTGEAVPARKIAGAVTDSRPVGVDQPMICSGSLIVRGTGMACVPATGKSIEIGKIGTSLGQRETETPHLRRRMRKLVTIFAAVGAAVRVAVIEHYGLLRGGWLDEVLAGIAVGMSMLPEEFPMVLAVVIGMGAWRISQMRVLTRRASVIENLGRLR